MANAILTSPLNGTNGVPGMPEQALVAILANGSYQLSYERDFDGLAPSLASAVVAGAVIQASPEAQSLLVASVTVDLNDDSAEQALYEVPADFVFIPYRIDIRNASTSLTTAAFSIGFNGATADDIVANATYVALTGPTLYSSVFPKAGATIGEEGNILALKVNTEQGAAATAIIDVLGYLVAVEA